MCEGGGGVWEKRDQVRGGEGRGEGYERVTDRGIRSEKECKRK